VLEITAEAQRNTEWDIRGGLDAPFI
jgi:hypothetical protein